MKFDFRYVLGDTSSEKRFLKLPAMELPLTPPRGQEVQSTSKTSFAKIRARKKREYGVTVGLQEGESACPLRQLCLPSLNYSRMTGVRQGYSYTARSQVPVTFRTYQDDEIPHISTKCLLAASKKKINKGREKTAGDSTNSRPEDDANHQNVKRSRNRVSVSSFLIVASLRRRRVCAIAQRSWADPCLYVLVCLSEMSEMCCPRGGPFRINPPRCPTLYGRTIGNALTCVGNGDV
ncbi:hypothetical protein RRG08_040521 [Elysia crispata]|uniref:Uncharacterized protein n=1 Tax=Elysia crispata TaxID=231223 RepID=A0AAE1DA02_9GAST|nr:hypothetical protein RRG08_040521 [Elysia crispata]